MAKDKSKRFKHILVPNMAPIHFELFRNIFRHMGYQVDVLTNSSNNLIQEGLRYVHNDTCYPALVVIGQVLDALKTKNYDPETTAVVLTQTGGGCRASNYLKLLRKALDRAGYEKVSVLSLNLAHLEKENHIHVDLKMIRRMVAGLVYGDLLMFLGNQIRPYEKETGKTDDVIEKWVTKLSHEINHGHALSIHSMKKYTKQIAHDLATIETEQRNKIKVGVVGEIFVKYSSVGNNNLEQFLLDEGCEIRVPGIMGFVLYSISARMDAIELYGGSSIKHWIIRLLYRYVLKMEKVMIKAIDQEKKFEPMMPFTHTKETAKKIIGLGAIMGEGWLLTAEMAVLCEEGFPNIICTQPFGCLPNHIVGKGMIRKIKEIEPNANIVPIDYDPSATKVNQENRIKLMLSVARNDTK